MAVQSGDKLAMPRSTSAAACRLLIDPPGEGALQMAIDEVLLASAAKTGTASLRFYEWSRPTLSLGYFQPYHQRHGHVESRNCAVVRRPTGGGAILHDQELTYSVAVPLAHPLAHDAHRLYLAAHEALEITLGNLHIPTALCDRPPGNAGEDESFLCFQRIGLGDVLLEGRKVCGSAQRRRRGAILQHGSVLVRTSPFAPQLAGIVEISGKSLDIETLRNGWQRAIAEKLALSIVPGELSLAERAAAGRLAAEKYAAMAWTRRR